MANNLIDSELILEEKKPKRLYKNWKLYASALGIIVIGTGTGLGIYYGIESNNPVVDLGPAVTDQDFADAINEANYAITVKVRDVVAEVNKLITPELIHEQLLNEFYEGFNPDSFKFNRIAIDDRTLEDTDLLGSGPIDAQIDYNYGIIENQTTKLTINVVGVDDQQIVTAINNTNYQTEIKVNSATSELSITDEFIKTELSEEVKTAFNPNSFSVNQITVAGEKLKDNDLTTSGPIDAQIDYNYGSFKNQTTNLKIEVTGIDNKQIVAAINSVNNYQLTVNVRDDVTKVTNQIDSKFIKEKLTDKIKTAFNADWFGFNQVMINDRKLNNDDLLVSAPLKVQINYNYGGITNQTTKLTINVVGVDDQQIVEAINDQKYQTEVKVNSAASSVIIDGNFIKEKLTDEVKVAFIPNSFSVNQITVAGEKLKDNDLTTSGPIDAQIDYNYGSFKNQTTNLKIEVTGIDNKQIITAINSVNYQTEVKVNSKAKDLIITSDFIKNQLSNEIKTAFNDKLFNFNKITVAGEILKDNDLTTSGTIDALIDYNYGSFKNQTTNLKIKVTGIDNKQIVTAINGATYQTEVKVSSAASAIKITSDFIKNQLNSDIKAAFNDNLFKVDSITVNGKNLTDNDLITVRTIETQINYNYGSMTNQKTKLMIKVTGVDSQQIVDAINKENYELEVEVHTKVSEVKLLLDSNFIKQVLSENIQDAFDDSLFKLNKIIVDGENLEDSDLTDPKLIETQINYNYGTIVNQTTKLTINIGPITEDKVVEAINKMQCDAWAVVDETVEQIGNIFKSGDYIVGQFKHSTIYDKFRAEFEKNKGTYKFIRLMYQNRELRDSDLKTAKTIDIKIVYNYGTHINQETNLKLEIKASRP
ncbi:MAG: hypothetical protein REH79_00610 [Spiroplasma sp.]|nr:hypothetical protein [Spiroplasma sp.]